jgi:hypothetical protein
LQTRVVRLRCLLATRPVGRLQALQEGVGPNLGVGVLLDEGLRPLGRLCGIGAGGEVEGAKDERGVEPPELPLRPDRL